MEILSVSKSWKKLWFSADQNICCFKMKVAEEFIFSVFLCRTVYLILSSKVFCRQIQNVFQRSHVTVFLEHCISLKGKPFNTKLFVVPYENAWIFSENRNWKKSIFDLSYSVRKKVTELIHFFSAVLHDSRFAPQLASRLLSCSGPQSWVIYLISRRNAALAFRNNLRKDHILAVIWRAKVKKPHSRIFRFLVKFIQIVTECICLLKGIRILI